MNKQILCFQSAICVALVRLLSDAHGAGMARDMAQAARDSDWMLIGARMQRERFSMEGIHFAETAEREPSPWSAGKSLLTLNLMRPGLNWS
ncbi:MAG: hypothetical protein HS122_05175 [Opitutaceae bacterium]|nr:hypothetical protein [Opitutaceae bacterium]